jgi:glycosyltransferase involved in cell wall biosynthesis
MNFSIITCTYNPNQLIFQRLINAVANLQIPENLEIEWIIVDNNSPTPINSLEYLQIAAKQINFLKIITEKNQGLTSARIAGVKASKFDWIIFFDDDNEPLPDYLIELDSLIKNYPQVGCWGPGRIKVEFVNQIFSKSLAEKTQYFQERNIKGTIHSANPDEMELHPVGSGLVNKKTIFNNYIKIYNEGKILTSDRIGNSLASGGDLQILFLSLKLKYEIGLSEKLKINHLIPQNRTTLKYLIRLNYGTASSFVLSYNEIYYENPIRTFACKNYQILLITIQIMSKYLKKFNIIGFIMAIASKYGEINSNYYAKRDINKPIILRIFERIFI